MTRITSLALLFSMFFTITGRSAENKNYRLVSPDGRLNVELHRDADGRFTYSLTADKKRMIEPSTLGFEVDASSIPSAGWSIDNVIKNSVRGQWIPLWGKRAVVEDRYNELVFEWSNAAVPSGSIGRFHIVVRAYNDGIALRYVVPSTAIGSVAPTSELTQYNFADDYTAWYYNGEQHNIGPERLTATDGTRLPVMTIQADSTHYMALHEADLRQGNPLVLGSTAGQTSFNVASAPGAMKSGYTSPWRVILFGATPGVMVDSHIIELLNPDPDPELDFGWVKPGVAVWDWRIDGAQVDWFTYTMSYPSWVRMVDFAAENGMKHLVLDANWYGPEHEAGSDPINGDKAAQVQQLLRYGKEKGVGIWLYLNDVGGRQYPIEQTLKQYGDWGAAGVKYGFMSGSPQQKNERTRLITRLCAENHLLVDFHDGPVHPYGQMRTWPNAVTREYCHAQLDGHHVFVPSTFVTSVFVNMIAGPIDMNNGMFDLRQGHTTRVDESQPVPSTLVSEAARTLIVFSGATILPDVPEYYRKYPVLLDFIAAQQMPWVESRTLSGQIGEYIVMMRQTKDAYLVGAATNENGRTLDVDLSFLPKGKYELTLVQDGEDAHYLTHRESLKVDSRIVSRRDKVSITLAPGGGTCMLLKAVKR